MILVAVGVFFIFALWGVIFQNWQRGVVMLLIYLPFAGVVSLSLYPSSMPILFKDFFFVIPAYLAFLLSKPRRSSPRQIPSSIIFAILALSSLVFIQMFNPGIANWMVPAIGAKVWLFYLPLIFLIFAMVKSFGVLIRLLRLMIVISWIPCGIGIMQWISSMTLGYGATMSAFYGAAAEGATQGFASFEVGGNFFRIPSTFTFVTQYFGYTLAMIVPAYALMKMDPSQKWRKFSTAIYWFVILASFMSGARSAYLFVPILLVLIALLEGKVLGVLRITVVLPLALIAATYIAGIDPIIMFGMMTELLLHYSDEIVKKGLLDAIATAPLGIGTGMNTGPARYAFDDPDSFIAFENYYAKAVYELGVAGLVLVVGLFLLLIRHGYRIHRRIQGAGFKSCSAAILAFIITIALNSFKGWQIDLDPINVYFWVFSGMLLRLGYLDKLSQTYTKGDQTNAIVHQGLSALASNRT